jgi:hypothetical protein
MDSMDMPKTNIRIDIPIVKIPCKRQLSSAVGGPRAGHTMPG